ncbi:MAG: glycosyltransferase family 29 protein [Candidatus Omnitrophica bacterium]|nr:glycosyltransferase family 29 protein [Candidatus Omnitrophota bacterium]
MLRINCWKEFRDNKKIESIAVIGNAPSALEFPIGEEIEKADLIIRMNNYRVEYNFQQFIGSRTDIFICNFYRPDIRKKLEDVQKDGAKYIWSSIPYSNFNSRWKSDLDVAQMSYSPYPIFVPSDFDFFRAGSVRFLSAMLNYVLSFLLDKRYKKPKGDWAVPTTGMMAIYLALKLKPKVLIVSGFNFFTSSNAHYFSNNSSPTVSHHNYSGEINILEGLITNNPMVKFVLAFDPSLFDIERFRKYKQVSLVAKV